MTHARQFCTFLLDGELYGIAIDDVQEVLRRQPVTRVRAASPAVLGLMNLRGRIVTVVDLRAVLGKPPRPPGSDPANVVVAHEGHTVSLWVDEVGEVRVPDPRSLEHDGNSRTRPGHEAVRLIYKLEDRLLQILDVPELLQGVFA